MKKEEKIFEDYLESKHLKYSGQRVQILKTFLSTEKHLTADDLYRIVQKKYPTVGYATIYRTLKLLCKCGLCRCLMFEDKVTRYEHLYGHQHHEHLICTKCGKFVEIFDSGLERIQVKLLKSHGFHPQGHGMELYGICKSCK